MRNLRSPGTFHEVEREQIRLVDPNALEALLR